MHKNRFVMKTVEVFLVDDNNEVIQDYKYNVLKMVKDNHNYSTMLVLDHDGDVAFVRAKKDYSVDPFRYVVSRKFLLPFLIDDEEE